MIFQWKYILTACLLLVAAQAIFGTLFLKYGKAGNWVLWGVWMVACIGGPRMMPLLNWSRDTVSIMAGQKVLLTLQGITEGRILWTLTVLALGLILLSYWMLRKQQVKL